MNTRWIIVGLLAVLSVTVSLKGDDPAGRITARLTVPRFHDPQPCEGSARFLGSPGYAKPCSVQVDLIYMKSMRTGEVFRMECSEACGLAVSPDSVIWSGPIDSGRVFSAVFVFQPREIGTYVLTLLHRAKKNWEPLTSLTLAIDEDGKTVYAGATADCHLAAVPLHPLRTSPPLTMRFPIKGLFFDPAMDRHFTGEMRFSRQPAVNETTYVDFTLQCVMPIYSQVQFILDYSTNLKVSELPPSWGDRIALTDSSRYYSGRFWFVPQRAGIGVLNLRVVGKKAAGGMFARGTTEFPVYFVIGDDGQFLMLSSFEPWTRYKDKNDPMLSGATALLEVTNRDHKLKQVLSKPDYQDTSNPVVEDSVGTGR